MEVRSFRRAGAIARGVAVVLVLTALFLFALAMIVIRTAPTVAGLVVVGLIVLWLRGSPGPFVPEEALLRARLRHRFWNLDGCRWLDKVAEDDSGALYRSHVRWPWWDEQISLLEVCNHTPEPDGEFRSFVIRVPPTIATARAAVAWTFHMNERDYRPEDES